MEIFKTPPNMIAASFGKIKHLLNTIKSAIFTGFENLQKTEFKSFQNSHFLFLRQIICSVNFNITKKIIPFLYFSIFYLGYHITIIIHYLFDTSRVYTMVKITLKQNYIQLYVS